MIGRFKCEMCKNFLSGGITIDAWKCKAYPNGIPELKIAYITFDSCVNCNNGIGFEPIEEVNEWENFGGDNMKDKKYKSNIPDELIEKIWRDYRKAKETVDDDWDEETRKDWEEKMNS